MRHLRRPRFAPPWIRRRFTLRKRVSEEDLGWPRRKGLGFGFGNDNRPNQSGRSASFRKEATDGVCGVGCLIFDQQVTRVAHGLELRTAARVHDAIVDSTRAFER